MLKFKVIFNNNENIIIVANSWEQAKKYARALAKLKKVPTYSLSTKIN